MCDTLVALGNSTDDRNVIFGKNSDRPQNEIQLITYAPNFHHAEGDTVRCTYISIPQVKETAAILLSQPFWMWGAEMGANEHGVVIGNEAVYTYEGLRSTGLIGMDLLRLGLERGISALNSVHVITKLLEQYHQGGGCAYDDPSWSYHNSFLIADSKEAYVLETADDWWIVEKVSTVRSISNGITIRGKGDFRRKGIIQHAIDSNYCKDEDDFDFALTFSGSSGDSPFSRGSETKKLLNENLGEITPALMMNFLRDHNAGICMHGGFESTGSQVSQIQEKRECSVHWFTGTTLPCLSLYKPYNFSNKDLEYLKPGPYSNIDPNWFWVKHKKNLQSLSDRESFISNNRKYESTALDDLYNRNNCNNDEKSFLKNIHNINQEMWKNSFFK